MDIKPSERAHIDFALASITAASVPGGDPDETATDAWAIANQMVQQMPKHLRDALRRADELWEAKHG